MIEIRVILFIKIEKVKCKVLKTSFLMNGHKTLLIILGKF